MTKKIFLFFLLFGGAVYAQPTKPTTTPTVDEPPKSLDHFNQEALRAIQDNQIGNPDEIPQVFYDYYVVKEQSRLRARLNLYEYMGINHATDAKSKEGQVLIQLINRNLLEDLQPGDTLVVPTQLGLDLRAYSPFPRYYQAAKEHKKIVILDKEIQAFAAYEDGVLRRWGIINTGTDASQTPEGRFNVNWKAENRISSLSPGVLNPKKSDEMWDMTWVMNIHEKRGIHMHQYAMPTGGPASHGCVRMNDADAEWLFNWVDIWETSKANAEECTSAKDCKILKQGTMVLVLGPDPKGKAQPFVYKNRYPILKIIDLPTDPYAIPAGTEQQKIFDRIRLGRGTTANRGALSPGPKTTQAKPRTTAKPKNNQVRKR